MCIPIEQTFSQIVTSSNVEASTHDVSHLNDDLPASPTESLLHAAASSSDPQPSSYSKRLGMANHWRNAVDGEEELYFNRVADTILKAIEPECTTSQGVSHEYDPLAVQMTLQGFGDEGDPGRLPGCDMGKLTTYVDGSTHVEGTAELGSWEDVDEVSVPVKGHQPEDYGEIEDPPYQPRNPLSKQPFGYTTEDSYTGSGWDFYSYGPPYTPMCSWPSTPVETVAQAGSSISHCSSGPLVVDTSDLEVSAVIPHSDPSLKLESAPSIPQNSVSWEPQCRKLFRSFSVNAEKELAEVGHFIRFLRPEIRS